MKAKTAAATACALLAVELAAFGCMVALAQGEATPSEPARLAVSDKPQEPFVMSYQRDMQRPELPTGCEAVALSTLLRMHGFEDATKTAVADAMPKSEGGDFVTAFWGDPYTEQGWACMAPCAVLTSSEFLPSTMRAVEGTGTPLGEVPAPFVAWVTIGLDEAVPSGYEQHSYRLLANSHCVVVTEIEGVEVRCIDPLAGLVSYERAAFEAAFVANGRQSVYLERV